MQMPKVRREIKRSIDTSNLHSLECTIESLKSAEGVEFHTILSSMFPVIDMGFLKTRLKGTLATREVNHVETVPLPIPKYGVFSLKSNIMRIFSTEAFNEESEYGRYYMQPKSPYEDYFQDVREELYQRDRSYSQPAVLTTSYIGLLPKSVKSLLKSLTPVLDSGEIFIISERKLNSWTLEEIPSSKLADPLLVLHRDVFTYLLAIWDPTDSEKAVYLTYT